MKAAYFVLALATWLAPAVALGASPFEPFPASTHVVAVPDASHIVVAHGRKDRFPADAKGLIVSPRGVPRAAGEHPPVDFGVVIALADTVRVDDETALLRLRDTKQSPKIGDHVSWAMPLGKSDQRLRAGTLFWAAALDIGARSLASEQDFFALRDLVADPSAQARALTAMVEEIHAHADLARTVYVDAIDRGPYRGRQLVDIFTGTSEADVLAFWAYVVSAPARYTTYRFKLVDIYATWLVRGAPSAPPMKPERLALEVELGQLVRRQDWERAEERLVELLRLVPDDAGRRAELEHVTAIRRADAALLRDPGDDSAAWLRARALAAIGLYPAAIVAFETLIVRDFKVHEAKLQLGFSLCGAARWDECADHFDQLIRARGRRREPDAQLEKWRSYARTRGVQSGSQPSADAAAHIDTARALESEGAWSNALASWRSAIVLARSTADAASLQAAELGLRRAGQRAALVERVDAGIAALREHRVADADGVLAAVRDAAREMGEPEAGSGELRALAAVALAVGEHGFARRVLELCVQDLAPPCTGARCAVRGVALADLAEQVARDGDLARAEALFEEAVKLAPESVEARAKRAWFFAERGRWSDAYSASFIGSGQSVSMAYTLVRASVARARFDDAVQYADRLAQNDPELGLIAAAVHHLAAAGAVPGAVRSEPDARRVLRRIRGFVDVGLERVVFGELERLAAFPALQREAAWAIANPRYPRPPGLDLMPLADRLAAARMAVAGAPTPERRRRLAVLAARARLAATPDVDLRLALSRALLIDGAFHEAWALARLLPEPASSEIARRARRGVQAERVLAHAREARERGDPQAQRALADEAQASFDAIGSEDLGLDAALVGCEALLALGLHEAGYAKTVQGLAAARMDGRPERVRAFEALLARLLDSGWGASQRLRAVPPDPASAPLPPYDVLLRAHLEQCRELDDDRCLARAQHELGLVAIQQGRVSEARAALDEAIAGFAIQHDGPRVRRATMALARIHRLRSELDLAVDKTQEVLDAAIDDGDGIAEREALLELGSLALAQGDLGAARKWLASAREAGERGNDELASARAEADLGRAELLLDGDLEAALVVLQRSMGRFDKLGATADALAARIDLVEALVLASRSSVLPRLGRGGKRIDRPFGQRAAARALTLIRDAAEVALSLGRDVLRLRAMLALAAARIETRDPAGAAPVLADAAALATGLEYDDLLARALHLQAKVALAEGRRQDAARIALDAARSLASSLARGAIPLGRAESEAVFQQAADLLFELGRHEDALELLELQRTVTGPRVFDLAQLRRSANPALAAELARYAEARARADAVQARLREQADAPGRTRDALERAELIRLAAASQAELRPLAERLELEHPVHWKALARDPTSLAADRKKLPKGAILVEYFVTIDALYLFVVRPGRAPQADGPGPALGPITALRVAVDAAALSDRVTRYRKLLATDGHLAEPLGRELHDWLLAPIARLVPPGERGAATVILLPHGPLFDVPFAALISSGPDAPVRYAIEDWRLTIASASTLSALLAGPRRLAVLGPVLGLADPDGSLPEARKELDRLPAAMRATILRGAEATEERLRSLSPVHRILHFATHGVRALNPLDSALLLASGQLTVERIAGLEMLRGKVALVFLSACQSASEPGTSHSDAFAEPEAMSLAEGFALAGVPTLIGSLWDVDDRATRLLVEAFYLALATGTGDTLDALREAQLATLATTSNGQRPFADPRFWSAFQLIGDFR